jgi:ATPase
MRSEGFLEIERNGSTIAQVGKYRIVITKPPFSDGWEITGVKPVKSLTINDYEMSEKLMKRIK